MAGQVPGDTGDGHVKSSCAGWGAGSHYRFLFDANPNPMWIYDLETLAILAVNEAAIQHYGYSRKEFLGMTIKDIRPPEDVPRLMENVSQVTEGLDRAGVWRHIKKDGSLIYVEITSHTLTFAGRRAELVLAHDITRRIETEDALRQALAGLETQRAEMEALARKVIEAQERERLYLASHIHDELVQGLVATSLFLQGLDISSLDKKVRRSRDALVKVVASSIGIGRRLLREIGPVQGPRTHLAEAVRSAAEALFAGTGTGVNLDIPGDLPRMETSHEINILRIIQEAMMNVRKHADASQVWVTLRTADDWLEVEVRDDGAGFDPGTVAGVEEGHYGMLTMHERAGIAGGTIQTVSEPGKGTTVRGRFPVKRTDA